MIESRAQDLRRRILNGEEISDEEMKEILEALIADRAGMLLKVTAKKVKSKAEPVDLSDLLG